MNDALKIFIKEATGKEDIHRDNPYRRDQPFYYSSCQKDAMQRQSRAIGHI